MSVVSESASGREGAREVVVWDPLVRLIHWSLALMILLNGAFTDDDGALHQWVGYVALGLVGIRTIWAIIGPQHARFAVFPPSPMRALRYLRARDRTVHLSHNPLGALMVYNLWLTVIALGVTGYMMTTPKFFGLEWVEEVHELAFNWLMLSVALHVAGVVFDTWRSGVNLVRAMITGRKRIPKGTSVE
ncbi:MULTISPECIES: cytochrome b/b6 domain-containing protein [Roseobacteraceae]|jgi:cytochrome b|uniref:Prokaryotic cytochrome b561 n=1 Tax=Pseudosulfitobacter pseudonitzschiae TaxID=1402135 RepID=A0A221K430_9RHOB|nr:MULTISPECIES: cytochrome b/b6 domain-containing protein [Roseobacteraceae]ASM73762.1 prokaryotic cytochrome b561 [Pseudosulfitobacter pseudonitzschiae]